MISSSLGFSSKLLVISPQRPFFSFSSPFILTNHPKEIIKFYQRYGLFFGLIFQIIDDLIDETKSFKLIGKTPGKDKKQGKSTLLDLMGKKNVISFCHDEINQFIKKKIEVVIYLQGLQLVFCLFLRECLCYHYGFATSLSGISVIDFSSDLWHICNFTSIGFLSCCDRLITCCRRVFHFSSCRH